MTPRTLVPYVIALGVAAMVIAGGVLFVTKTRVGLSKRVEAFKADLLTRKKTGTLPAEWQGKDIEGLDLEHIQMKLPADAQLWVDVADFLVDHRVVLTGAVLVVCLGGAVIFNGWRGAGEVTGSPSPTASPVAPVR